MSQDINDKLIYELMGDVVLIFNKNNLVPNSSFDEAIFDIKRIVERNRNPYQKWYVEEKCPQALKLYDEIYDGTPEGYCSVISPIELMAWYLSFVHRNGYTVNHETRRSALWSNITYDDLVEEMNYNREKENRPEYDTDHLLIQISEDCKKSINDLTELGAKVYRPRRMFDVTSISSFGALEEFSKKELSFMNLATKLYEENIKNTKRK